MTTATVFLDTKTLLNFKPLDKIDWREILHVDAVVLQIVPIVIEQLHKVTLQDISLHLQRRARFTFSNLSEQLERGGYLSPGVALATSPESSLNFELEGLNRTSARDQIIASIISFQRDNPLEYVLLVSSDEAMLSRAPDFGIDVITLPEQYRFPIHISRPPKTLQTDENPTEPSLSSPAKSRKGEEDLRSNTVPRIDPATLPSFKRVEDFELEKGEVSDASLLAGNSLPQSSDDDSAFIIQEDPEAASDAQEDLTEQIDPFGTTLESEHADTSFNNGSKDEMQHSEDDAWQIFPSFADKIAAASVAPLEEESNLTYAEVQEEQGIPSPSPTAEHHFEVLQPEKEEEGNGDIIIRDSSLVGPEEEDTLSPENGEIPDFLQPDEEDTAPPMPAGEADWLQPDEEDTAPPMPAGEADWLQPDEEDTAPPMPAGEADWLQPDEEDTAPPMPAGEADWLQPDEEDTAPPKPAGEADWLQPDEEDTAPPMPAGEADWLQPDEEDTAPPMPACEADWLQPDEEDTAPPMPAGEADWLQPDEEDTAPPMPAGEADWLQPDEEDTAPPIPEAGLHNATAKENPVWEVPASEEASLDKEKGLKKEVQEEIMDSPFLQSMDSKPRFKELNTRPAPLPSFEFLSGSTEEAEEKDDNISTEFPDWQAPHSIVPNLVPQEELEEVETEESISEKSDLLVQFSEGEKRKNVLIRFPIKLSNGQVKKKIENLYNQYPKIPDIGPDASFRVGDGAFINKGEGDQKLLLERRLLRIKRYNASLDAFYAEHERYIHELSEHENQTKRSILPAFRLVNNTEMTLRSIYVTLHFPSIVRVFSEDSVPATPAGPPPPHIPDLDAPFDLIQLPTVPLPPELRQTENLRLRHPNIPPNEVKWNNGWDAVYSIREIKPNNHVLLNPLIVTFNSFESAKSIKIQYRIVAASISREERGNLELVVRKQIQ